MPKRKFLRGIIAAAVVIPLVLFAACSTGPAAVQTPEPSGSPSALLASPTSLPNPEPDPDDPFAYDPSRPFNEMELSAEKTETGVNIREMSYDAYNKTINASGTVKFYLVEPKGEGPFPFVLYFHWLGSPNGNKKEFLDEAVSMAEKGVGGFLIDGFFPWKGVPVGDAEKDTSKIIYQVNELRRAIDYIQCLPNADSGRIGYVGHDYGAMFGAVLSGVEDRIDSYVLIAGMGDFGRWFMQYWVHLSGDKKQAYLDAISTLDPVNYVSKAEPAALFFQFADDDGFITKDIADTFYNAASEPKEAKLYESDHSMRNEEARSDRDDWLIERLK